MVNYRSMAIANAIYISVVFLSEHNIPPPLE